MVIISGERNGKLLIDDNSTQCEKDNRPSWWLLHVYMVDHSVKDDDDDDDDETW